MDMKRLVDALIRLIKVGNQPALYVLYKSGAFPDGGVQPGGIAEAITPPSGYSWWSAATSFALTRMAQVTIFLMDRAVT